MRKTSFNPQSIGEMSGSAANKAKNYQSMKGSTAKIGSFADYLDYSCNQSIAQVNDYENLNESEKLNNKVKEYHSKLYMTNTTKLSQNLMTSTSMTFTKRKGRKSTMQQWVLKDPGNITGTKVTNFRKEVIPLRKNLSPFEKINSEILNDSKWGSVGGGSGGGATLYTKFPKYLPKIIKRDSSILNGGGQTPLEIYGNRTHARRMSGFSTNLKRLISGHGKLHHSSIGEL